MKKTKTKTEGAIRNIKHIKTGIGEKSSGRLTPGAQTPDGETAESSPAK